MSGALDDFGELHSGCSLRVWNARTREAIASLGSVFGIVREGKGEEAEERLRTCYILSFLLSLWRGEGGGGGGLTCFAGRILEGGERRKWRPT
jgi:hypothetical protein